MPRQYHTGNPAADKIIPVLDKAPSGLRPDDVFSDWLELVEATLEVLPAHAHAIAATGQLAEDSPAGLPRLNGSGIKWAMALTELESKALSEPYRSAYAAAQQAHLTGDETRVAQIAEDLRSGKLVQACLFEFAE